MKDPDSFRCRQLDRAMTVSRCVRNQRGMEEYFGTEPPKKGTCHLCGQGQEIRDLAVTNQGENKKGEEMPKEKVACRNCGRVKTVVADRLCWACYDACRRLEKGSKEYNAALAGVKDKAARGEIKERPRKAAQGETKEPERETVRAEEETKAPAEEMKPVKIGGAGEEKIIPITLLINVEVNVRAIRVG